MLSLLAQRLEPVLSAPPQTAAQADNRIAEGPRSKVGSMMEHHLETIGSAREAIESILQRLQV